MDGVFGAEDGSDSRSRCGLGCIGREDTSSETLREEAHATPQIAPKNTVLEDAEGLTEGVRVLQTARMKLGDSVCVGI